MNIWNLPTSANIGGKTYQISADFRDVLEIISILNDENKPNFLRWQIALSLFYNEEIPKNFHAQAMEYLSEFISYGSNNKKPAPKMIDWDQDAQMILSDVNKVAGTEVRATNFMHWWTFLTFFYSVGDGQLATVVSIRKKKRTGKKLEKWEETYYRENREQIDFKRIKTVDDLAAQDYFNKWL